MKKVILIIVLMGYIFSGFSQSREEIKKITIDSVYNSIQNDSIIHYVENNIEELLEFKGDRSKELKIFENFILLHNKNLTIYTIKNFENVEWLTVYLNRLKIDSLRIEDLNYIMKVAIMQARERKRDTVINGEKVTIINGLYSFEKEVVLEAFQKTTGDILQKKYNLNIKKPESLNKQSAKKWYLEIINKALQEHPEKEKELTFLKEEIEDF